MGHPMSKKGFKKRGEKFFQSKHERKFNKYDNYSQAQGDHSTENHEYEDYEKEYKS